MRSKTKFRAAMVAAILVVAVGIGAAEVFAGEVNQGQLNRDGQPFPATYWSNVEMVGTADAGYWRVDLVDGSVLWVTKPEHVQMVILAKLYGLPFYVTWADERHWTELLIRY